MRGSTFLESLPEKYKKDFVDVNPIAPEKLNMLKQMLKERFGVSFTFFVFNPFLESLTAGAN